MVVVVEEEEEELLLYVLLGRLLGQEKGKKSNVFFNH